MCGDLHRNAQPAAAAQSAPQISTITPELIQRMIQESVQAAMGNRNSPGQDSKTQPVEFVISTDSSSSRRKSSKAKSNSDDSSHQQRESYKSPDGSDEERRGGGGSSPGPSTVEAECAAYPSRKRREADKVEGIPEYPTIPQWPNWRRETMGCLSAASAVFS